jgi:trans-aconitate 2-methyltransferase
VSSDWDGRRYDEVNALQRYVAEESLATLTLRGDERVLDVGCGDGRVTAEIAARLPRGSVLGVDPSPRMLAVARERVSAETSNLAFVQGAAETLDVGAQFDVVVSFNALHWVADLGLALVGIRRALVDGGTAYLQLVCDGERPSVEDVTYEVTRAAPYAEYLDDRAPAYHHVDPAVVESLARDHGLVLAHGRVDDLAWDFGDAAALRDWLRVGFADWLRPLPDDAMREALLVDAARAYENVAGSASVVRFLQLRDTFVAT